MGDTRGELSPSIFCLTWGKTVDLVGEGWPPRRAGRVICRCRHALIDAVPLLGYALTPDAITLAGVSEMKRMLIGVATVALMAMQGIALAGDVAEKAEVCIDCHELEEFKGMDAAALAAGVETGNANNKMMAKSLADVSPEDLQAIIDHLAAEANK